MCCLLGKERLRKKIQIPKNLTPKIIGVKGIYRGITRVFGLGGCGKIRRRLGQSCHWYDLRTTSQREKDESRPILSQGRVIAEIETRWLTNDDSQTFSVRSDKKSEGEGFCRGRRQKTQAFITASSSTLPCVLSRGARLRGRFLGISRWRGC